MKKIVSFVLIMMVVLSLACPVFADDIDMNLSLNSTNQEVNDNVADNNAVTNIANTSTSTTKVSTVNQVENSSLGISNILNITLLVIGILLVLLSIAILIRLK